MLSTNDWQLATTRTRRRKTKKSIISPGKVNEVPIITLKNIASRRISKAISLNLTNRSRLQARFLKAVCSKAGTCLAFGRESNKIKDYFNGFKNFEYAVGTVRRIGSVSTNGFVNEISYARGEYNALAVLKSSANPKADNLFYEYTVGQFINKYAQQFPCFVETYGIFTYNTSITYDTMKMNKLNQTDLLVNGLSNFSMSIAASCQSSMYLAVLIQHFDNVLAIDAHVRKHKQSAQYFTVDLPCILYQVYAALGNMANVFTHNDLHTDNILVYEPFPDGYICFHYHYLDGTEVTFNSPYIPKIIDYGRCWFMDTSTNNSVKIHKQVCAEPSCGTGPDSCGELTGYSWLNVPVPTANEWYISAYYRNKTIDLRALSYLRIIPGKYAGPYSTYLRHILFQITPFIDNIGASEIIHSGLRQDIMTQGSSINNVNDAHIAFRSVLNLPYFSAENATYPNRTKKGDLHVYLDIPRNVMSKPGKPMIFMPTTYKM
jgi:hypothetical protein